MTKGVTQAGQTRSGQRFKGTVVMPMQRRVRSTSSSTPHNEAPATEEQGTEVISVTVPRGLVREARARTGKRGFSAFVSRAIRNELVRESQNELIEAIVAERGPLDEERMISMDRLFGGPK